jgi:hypothetical protein
VTPRKAPGRLHRCRSAPVIEFHSHIVVTEVCDFVQCNRPPWATEHQLADRCPVSRST